MKFSYKPRIADKLLKRKLAGKGAILIEGAKWCGKTTTAEQLAQSKLYMSETGKLETNRQLEKLSPGTLLKGEKPRLIDEMLFTPEQGVSAGCVCVLCLFGSLVNPQEKYLLPICSLLPVTLQGFQTITLKMSPSFSAVADGLLLSGWSLCL